MTSSLPINHRCHFLSWIVFFFFIVCFRRRPRETTQVAKANEPKENTTQVLFCFSTFHIHFKSQRKEFGGGGVVHLQRFPNTHDNIQVPSFTRITSYIHIFCRVYWLVSPALMLAHLKFKGTAQPKHKNTYFFPCHCGDYLSRIV